MCQTKGYLDRATIMSVASSAGRFCTRTVVYPSH